MKYHIKPLGMTKTQGFFQDSYGMTCFYNRGDCVSTSAVWHRA